MKTVFALFKDYQDIEEAVDRLLEQGFAQEKMNVIVLESVMDNFTDINQRTAGVDKSRQVGERTIFGLNQILAGLQAVPLTDIGKVRAAGDVAKIMTRAAMAPESNNDFTAVLQDFGLAEDDAQAYEKGLREGDILFFMPTEKERLAEVYNLMRQYKAEQVSGNLD